jgi:hypothetical protein
LRVTVGTLLVLPVGTFLVDCSSDMTQAELQPGPMQVGSTLVYTSTQVQNHTHTFGLEIADIDAPPANGVAGETSTEQGHSHTVSVTMAMLAQVAAGQSVTIATGSAEAHMHGFTLVKLSGISG